MQRAEFDRLGHVVIEARVARAATVVFLAPAGHGDQHHLRAARLVSDPPRHLVAAQFRQSDIQQDHIRLEGGRGADGFQSVVRGVHLVAHHAQQYRETVGGIGIVIHDQDAAGGGSR